MSEMKWAIITAAIILKGKSVTVAIAAVLNGVF